MTCSGKMHAYAMQQKKTKKNMMNDVDDDEEMQFLSLFRF
jgi:hypothetical protein